MQGQKTPGAAVRPPQETVFETSYFVFTGSGGRPGSFVR